MRKLIVSEFMTLDGVIEDPGGAEKSPFGGWSPAFWSDEAGKVKFDELFSAGGILLGRVTYTGFAAAWPSRKDEEGFADRMNSLPKFVASTTLSKADWNNSTILRRDVPAEVAKLKVVDGQPLFLFGSSRLTHSLMPLGLIDEYRVMVHPILVGGGKRLFAEGLERQNLKLIESLPLPNGVMALTYRPVEG